MLNNEDKTVSELLAANPEETATLLSMAAGVVKFAHIVSGEDSDIALSVTIAAAMSGCVALAGDITKEECLKEMSEWWDYFTEMNARLN